MSDTGTAKERIIVGVDAESSGTIAVDWVVRRARTRPVHITLVTAFDTLVDDPIDCRDRLIRLAGRITDARPDVTVEIELANASIHRTLEEFSRRADLVVIGSHRDRPIVSFFSGGLAARVAAHAHCPTVVVPHDWVPRQGAIVVGLGEDLTSEPAMIFAAAEAETGARVLEVVHAWHVPASTSMAVEALVSADESEDIRASHRDHLTAAVDRLRDEFPDLRISERLAELATGPALTSRGAAAELVVIGTHHRGPAVGLVLGSTASRLLHDSAVPLCIVPITEHPITTHVPAPPTEAIASVGV